MNIVTFGFIEMESTDALFGKYHGTKRNAVLRQYRISYFDTKNKKICF